MKYGYARVSTKDQNTARQLDAFRAEGVDVVVEEHASGKDFARDEYQRLRAMLKMGDCLCVMSLDRFGRNYDEIIDEWRYLVKEVGVDIKVLDMPVIDTTQGGGLVGKFVGDIVLQILAFVAQNEREMIHKRQEAGIAAAKARGVKFGRPRITSVSDEVLVQTCARITSGQISLRKVCVELGVSKSWLAAALKASGLDYSVRRGCRKGEVRPRRAPAARTTAPSPRKTAQAPRKTAQAPRTDWRAQVEHDLTLDDAARYAAKLWAEMHAGKWE